MNYTQGTIYKMMYDTDAAVEIMRCTKITKKYHYFVILSSTDAWVTAGTTVKYSRKTLRELYKNVTEYPPEKYPEYYL